MNTIVVYSSKTGYTEAYAKKIGEELSCPIKSLKEITPQQLSAYDRVIYGGWIMAGRISGYDKISAMNPKNPVIFAVGMTKPSKELTEKIKADNNLESLPFFYFPGGYRPKKLNFLYKGMLGMIRKSIEKKPEKTEDDLYALEVYGGADKTDFEAVKALTDSLK